MAWIVEMFMCRVTDYLKLFLMVLLITLFFPLLMIIPFLYVAYLSFYGKYGIVPIIKSLNYSL